MAATTETRLRLHDAHAALADEHRTLMALVHRLARHQHMQGLPMLLDELHTELIRHFSHEQFPGGLYEAMGAYGSEHHDDLKVLIEEHCRILSSVRGLLERARAEDPAEERGVIEAAGAVVEMMINHERREHRLADKLLRAAQ